MEYLELGDLERYLKPRLSPAEARQITQQLLEGLGFMHDNNFAHRDLKPSVSNYISLLNFSIN
jgi:calcium/calmodulin-dependent protein kinase I